MTLPKDRTYIKICGITRLGDARAAVSAGANAVGFIFTRSLRRISPGEAAAITTHLHPAVDRVGVFVNATPERILEVVDRAGLDCVQLQGSETPAYVEDLRRRRPRLTIFKVIRPTCAEDVKAAAAYAVDAVFLDPRDPQRPFEPVEPIPLAWLADVPASRFVVAGGLDDANVGTLVSDLRPWGVDVSAGVESAPGKKDGVRIRAFVRAVRAAEAGAPAR
ncbi:MAG TPA: phosphoribosylanthranilate isomerase [Actinomycetota bacterium]|nr:phosphoribosylanthranilate isomerase [Actinomycetota bacterium]